MKNYLGIIVFVVMTATHIQAKSRTCEEEIKRAMVATAVMAVSIPISGWLMGAMFAPMLSAQNSDKLCLKSASIIKNGMYNSQVLAKAHRRIEIFYQKLLKKYPDMTLSKTEVIDLLDSFNMSSVKNRTCMEYAGSLITSLFPDQKANAYGVLLKSQADQQEAHRQKIAHAKKVRAEKNGTDEIRYFDDI